MSTVPLLNPGLLTCRQYSPGGASVKLPGVVFNHRICRGSPSGAVARASSPLMGAADVDASRVEKTPARARYDSIWGLQWMCLWWHPSTGCDGMRAGLGCCRLRLFPLDFIKD